MKIFKEPSVAIINFKAYKEATGERALALARDCEAIFKETGKKVWIAVHPTDVRAICQAVSIPVLCQHADPVPMGAYTGWTPPTLLKEMGAKGTLLNHSEHQLSDDVIKATVDSLKKEGLTVIICADTPKRAEEVAHFKPDYVAVEPPELIGGDISVSTAKPEVITEAVNRVRKVAPIPVLCGAGVKNHTDVSKAIELGARGILVASGVTKANDPKAALLDLVSGFSD